MRWQARGCPADSERRARGACILKDGHPADERHSCSNPTFALGHTPDFDYLEPK